MSISFLSSSISFFDHVRFLSSERGKFIFPISATPFPARRLSRVAEGDGRRPPALDSRAPGNIRSKNFLMVLIFILRIACLFVPLFPLAARLRSEPELGRE